MEVRVPLQVNPPDRIPPDNFKYLASASPIVSPLDEAPNSVELNMGNICVGGG